MSVDSRGTALDLVPRAWFGPVLALWTIVLAVFGLELTFAGAAALLQPPEPVAGVGFLVTVVVAAFGYGVFAFGATAVYRRARGFDDAGWRSLDRAGRRWVGGLAAAGVVAMVLGGAWASLIGYPADLVAPTVGIGSPPHFDGGFPFSLGLAGVNELLNAAPYVAFVAALGGLLVGPAVGALFHGVLQDTLARILPAEVAAVSAAAAATMVLQNGAFTGLTTTHEALSAVVVFAFALGVAAAHEATDDLLVAMAAYGVFNVLATVLGWASVLASLHASGHLLG